MLADKLAAKLATPSSTPWFFVNVSILTGSVPKLERDVNARTNACETFLRYWIGLNPFTAIIIFKSCELLYYTPVTQYYTSSTYIIYHLTSKKF